MNDAPGFDGIREVLETAEAEGRPTLNLVRYTDGSYGIVENRKPLPGLHWTADGIERCQTEFTRLVALKDDCLHNTASNNSMSKKRVMIVDDEPQVTDMVKLHLERAGRYEVCTENDSRHVLEKARQFQPDVIVLDIMMPEPDGSELAAFLHEDPQFQQTPVIFLTALVSRTDSAAPRFGFDRQPYLAKPIDFRELMDYIDRAVVA